VHHKNLYQLRAQDRKAASFSIVVFPGISFFGRSGQLGAENQESSAKQSRAAVRLRQ
jgi:hypothetical protein